MAVIRYCAHLRDALKLNVIARYAGSLDNEGELIIPLPDARDQPLLLEPYHHEQEVQLRDAATLVTESKMSAKQFEEQTEVSRRGLLCIFGL